jgi:hypothetical protein
MVHGSPSVAQTSLDQLRATNKVQEEGVHAVPLPFLRVSNNLVRAYGKDDRLGEREPSRRAIRDCRLSLFWRELASPIRPADSGLDQQKQGTHQPAEK